MEATTVETVTVNKKYLSKIDNVLIVMDNYIEDELPSIKAIAENVGLGESTLKRTFRLIHKDSIYNYYLKKKMIHAKKLIDDGKVETIQSLASRLGYHKVSNFIQMYKKHHGVSPGRKVIEMRTTQVPVQKIRMN
jgi:AraC-like DNA-binding protein